MKVALGVTGCIAAYKAVEVLRGLQKAGLSVQVILTKSAEEFVTPLTFEALSGNPVITGMFQPMENAQIQHIRLAQEIDLLAVVPATANIIGKFAQGIADDFLSTLYLSCSAPVMVAPAMNTEMWNHPAFQDNLATLRQRQHHVINPMEGELACGTEGMGKLPDPEAIVAHILDVLSPGGPLSGFSVLVTAGPTSEDLDPVRFLTNRSSGKMGFALAQAARLRGAKVSLIHGPTSLRPPSGVDDLAVRSAAEMRDAVLQLYPATDIVLMAAAVADYRPAERAAEKLKKNRMASLPLAPTEDILAGLGEDKGGKILVGFAAETEQLLERAKDKLNRKNLDLVIANDVSQGVFGADTASVTILSSSGEVVELGNQSKIYIANQILDAIQKILAARGSLPVPG